MFEKPFAVEIVAPDRIVFKDRVTAVSFPGTVGGFQVLHSHAPLLSSIETGPIKIKDLEGRDHLIATSGGFVEVRDNVVVVLAETAERADEIDVRRATAARDRAEQRLRGKAPDLDEVRAEAALRRALNRLRIAGMA